MLIRSQDKKSFTSNLDLSVMEIAKRHEIVDGKRNTVAIYSTEEKAIKVLDMIEQAYCKSFEEQKQNYFGHRYDLIFQMPKDEEVE